MNAIKRYLMIGGMLIFALVSSFVLSINSPISMESYLLIYILNAIWGKELKQIIQIEAMVKDLQEKVKELKEEREKDIDEEEPEENKKYQLLDGSFHNG